MRFSLVIGLLFFILEGYSADIMVCPSCSVNTPEKAIAISMPGDRIIIEGSFTVPTLTITKPVSLIGKNAIITGDGKGDILLVNSDKVIIDGIHFIRSGASSVKDYAGIKIQGVSDITISNNHLDETYFAIYLQNASNINITGNRITGNAITETKSGNGIHMWKCNNINVADNIVKRHRDGIYFEFSESCQIENNLSTNNLRYGLHFMFSNKNIYKCNTFRCNGAGVAVMYTDHVSMIDNTFEENWGPTSYGLLLKEISRSTISGNKFIKNTIGINMEGASEIRFDNNDFAQNGWALRLMGNCLSDTFTCNNFENNTFDVVSNSFIADNENFLSGNFWDKYTGYDLNKDHVGDVPFRPISLFSTYIERIPNSVVLMRSFLIDLLDYIERALPSLIPETVVDERPALKRNESSL